MDSYRDPLPHSPLSTSGTASGLDVGRYIHNDYAIIPLPVFMK